MRLPRIHLLIRTGLADCGCQCLAQVLAQIICVFDSHRQAHQRQPNITRARELLSWGPNVQLPEGLERTIDYFAAGAPQLEAAMV
jgi:nucleoside-diphosphate-sugar epimerase